MSFEAMGWAAKVIDQREYWKPATRFVFLMLANRADEEGVLWPSVRWLMARTGLGESTVRDATRLIMREGLMVKDSQYRGDGSQTANRYRMALNQLPLRLHPATPGPLAGGGVSTAGPGGPLAGGGGPLAGPLETKEKTKKTSKDLPPAVAGAWEEIRQVYPKRSGAQPWQRAQRAFRARLQSGHDPTAMVEGTRRYALWCEKTGKVGTERVMQAATFFGSDCGFAQDWSLPAEPAAPAPPDWWTTPDGIRKEGARLGVRDFTKGEVMCADGRGGQRAMVGGEKFDMYRVEVYRAAGDGPWIYAASDVVRRLMRAMESDEWRAKWEARRDASSLEQADDA